MENIEPLINEINNITNDEYKFTLKSATLFEDADFCVIEIFYRDGILLNKSIKDKVETKILELVPSCFKYDIKFVKKFISIEQVTDNVNEFMTKNYNSITYKIDNIKNSNLKFEIEICIDRLSFEHANQKNLTSLIENYLKNLYEEYSFECKINEFIFVNNKLDFNNLNLEQETDPFAKRIINFTEPNPIIGEKFDGPAKYIMDITSPQEEITLCGKIKNIKTVIIKRKPKQIESNSEEINEENNIEPDKITDESQLENMIEKIQSDELPKYERTLYKWTLEGFTGNISCSILSTKENKSKLEKLKIGDTVASKGKVEKDSFTNSLAMQVKQLEYCILPEKFEEYIEYKKEKPFYEFVKPEPIVIYRQDDLMSFAREEIIPTYLQNKTFVCYDFETTGLHYENGDRIVEIGAVKIINGKITEKFVSFVNPDGRHIDEGASETTGIYDEDVASAPKDYEVLQDFYKFTRGAIIIGYNNINFDNVFLLGQGKKCRYNFDNPMEDVFRFAQKYVTGVKNYKLGTIAEKLGVILDKAHSAVYDAIATAEIFLKIAEKM